MTLNFQIFQIAIMCKKTVTNIRLFYSLTDLWYDRNEIQYVYKITTNTLQEKLCCDR